MKEALDTTNKYRKEHGADPLTINQELCKISQAWANHLAKTGDFQHSHLAKCGENLYKGTGKNYNGTSAIEPWYNEEKKYDYAKAEFTKETGRFRPYS